MHVGINQVPFTGMNGIGRHPQPNEQPTLDATRTAAAHDPCTVTPAELVEFAREHLSAVKYPREVRFLPELPKGPTGKILKNVLREG